MYIQLLKDTNDQCWLRLVTNGGIMVIPNKQAITKDQIDVAGVLAMSEYSPHYVEVFDVQWIIDHLLGEDNKTVFKISGLFAAPMEAYKCIPEALGIWQNGWDGES